MTDDRASETRRVLVCPSNVPPEDEPGYPAHWWVCRGRTHQWPERAHAERCCHTHTLALRRGAGPDEYGGPEPALPFAGRGLGYCWVLVPLDAVPAGGRFAPPFDRAAIAHRTVIRRGEAHVRSRDA